MSEDTIEELLKGLETSTSTLRHLIDDNEDLHQIQRANTEPEEAKHRRITESLDAVRRHANALFSAILCGWDGTCHEKHKVMLCLEHRCSQNQRASGLTPTLVKFTLLFSWQEQTALKSMVWHETLVETNQALSSRVACRNNAYVASP